MAIRKGAASPPPLTAPVEDYLKAIYELESRQGSAATSEVAEALEVAPASVTGMVRRLAAQAGLDVVGFRYLGQYPAYFMFNGPLFLAASLYEKTIARFEALHFLRGWILVTLQRPERDSA